MALHRYFAVLSCLAGAACTANTEEPIDFEQQIRPLLQAHCVQCHGPDKQKGGLRLDARSYAFRGGNSGSPIIAEKADKSLLIQRVTSRADDRMPPGDQPLSAAQIGLLKRWIDSGAHWMPTTADRQAERDPRQDHWAWQPVNKVTPPAGQSGSSSQAIDAFITEKLGQHKLTLAPEADRRTLIRRLSYDLLGLPPTPEEVQAFVNNPDPLAYEKLVDKYLASPQFGERWARHWLDIAHYADTHGFERDQRRDNAYHYRDWVIRAFNRDLPYNQFLRDQLAGDVLRPQDPEAVIATGFLAAGPWDFVGQKETPSPVLKRLARADDLDDMVTQIMTATCGVTINCARCHDHKLDPISQQEYYQLWAVFAGVKRGDRPISEREVQDVADRRKQLTEELQAARKRLRQEMGPSWSLSDVVGGGDGTGTGQANAGIDPATGEVQIATRGFLENAKINHFQRVSSPFIDGVVIPDGGETGLVPISSTGLTASKIPRTSRKSWDAIRNGPVFSQFSTKLAGVDVSQGHDFLGLHANVGITFDLNHWRKLGLSPSSRIQGSVGYFGQTARNGASVFVLLDGKTVFEKRDIGRADGLFTIELDLPKESRFLTLLTTDGGNGISHDQVGFIDARIVNSKGEHAGPTQEQIDKTKQRIRSLEMELANLKPPQQVYAIVTEKPTEVRLLNRGNPEAPKEVVPPGTISCAGKLPAEFGSNSLTDAQRRIALANWIVDPANPLTRRVIVNRLWQYHFGVGLVDTPSDLGLGGGRPSHPQLLDWLADRLLQERWSLKAIHKLICLSRTYRQSSLVNNKPAMKLDSGNRLLWRQNPRRLEAESLRDSILRISGKLNPEMFGPGYRDFEYREEYAPVYKYITADKPELWRRSIYRFIVRTTPQQFLTTLDCPDPANLTPSRTVTTTALQSLALLNDEFVLQQAGYLAERLKTEVGDSPTKQIERGFWLVFGRSPTVVELKAAESLVAKHGLAQLCRFLFNANEFVSVD